jgi:predicted amidohydrolase
MAVDALQLIAQAASASTSPSPTSPVPSPKSSVRVCSLQLSHRNNSETPWEATQRALACLTSVAQQEPDVDLFVLPELAPVGSSQNTFTKYLPLSDEWQQLYHRIDEAFRQQARELGVYIVYGTIGWQCRETDRSLKFTLQHKVVDRQGNYVAVYDKSYLSDLEMRFFEPGPRKTVSFSVDGFSFGLLVGDDLKYPNLARSLAREVDVLVHPSAEATPRYFRQCRAVENAVYVLGVEYGGKHCSMSIPPDPDHDLIALETEEEEGYLLTRIQRSALEYARTNFPFYRHMKTEAAVS